MPEINTLFSYWNADSSFVLMVLAGTKAQPKHRLVYLKTQQQHQNRAHGGSCQPYRSLAGFTAPSMSFWRETWAVAKKENKDDSKWRGLEKRIHILPHSGSSMSRMPGVMLYLLLEE